ncbi:complement C4-like [Leucoraja erinacea]|uniref:complement C4-like n=1 Tax=Leucoraja erinaceus TaxID=7782 RepID=UPI002456D795|nr:complement C4-like [Leucoraja erinacea]
MAVVDITLLSGLVPDTKYLDQMANGVEEYISSYEVKKGKLLLYLETIPYSVSCLVFPARQIVRLGLMQPADATLYDFYDPTTRCTVSYRPPEQNTMTSKLCEGPVCTCAAGGCPHEQDVLPDNLLGDDRTRFACYNPIVDYVFVAQVLNKTSLGYFDKYTMSVRIVYWKNDGDHAGGDEVRTFLHRSSCRLQLREGTEYLLMGKSGNIKHGAGIAQYLLSDTTWIEAIPSQTTCGLLTHREHCKQVKSFIEEFTFFGCEM